ncbi:hypothetical protein LUZ60_015893 [Juncus effusus]|nr:hypothetical protein LUZ60_015893 [Juncus effusus]
MVHSLVSNPSNLLLKSGAGNPAPKAGAQFCQRRALMYGLSTITIGSLLIPQNANAAKRRAPPPPKETGEKKDPNMSGLSAKLLANKKRKEAMKETIAKLREKGKPVSE